MKQLNSQRGSISILVSLALVGLLGFSGFAVDAGYTYIERVELSNALDAAILAAAQELPASPSKARTVATSYLQSNGVNVRDVQITIAPNGRSMEIVGTKVVEHSFMKLLGINSSDVHALSKVEIAPAVSVTGGLRPFAVEDFPYTYGTLITLKQGAGSSYNGNFGVVALGGSGSSVYEQNALYGYDGEIEVGDWIDTEPGNMASVSNQLKNYINSIQHTFCYYPRSSGRLWTVPLVDTLEVSGRDAVLVTGFAQVFVEDIEKKSGKIEIKARFVRFVVNGEMDKTAEDKGVYAMKLVY